MGLGYYSRALLLIVTTLVATSLQDPQEISIPVSLTPPRGASSIVDCAFGSFSIEFSFLADFTGNATHPNIFTRNLLANLHRLTGKPPIIRIGGTTQDRVLYDPTQTTDITNTFPSPGSDQPSESNIGPSFWSTLQTLPTTPFIFGLNLLFNGTSGLDNLLSETEETVKQLSGTNLYLLELGNEADLKPALRRPGNWSLHDYVEEWNFKTSQIAARIDELAARGVSVRDRKRAFMGPSFADIEGKNDFDARRLWDSDLGYDPEGRIREVSQHTYMASARITTNTLQGTLMNHTNVVARVAPQKELSDWHRARNRTFILAETNSLSGQGSPTLSTVFGAALWAADYNLWIMSQNITRIHMHQGTSYRYASWQPILSNGLPVATRPPYYGQIFTASFLGSSGKTRVANYDLGLETLSAYAAYDGRKLARIAVLNLREYNATDGNGTEIARPRTRILLPAPPGKRRARVELLTAPDARANSSITFAGWSYDYGLAEGKGVRVRNDTVWVEGRGGKMSVEVEDSQGILVYF